MNTPQQDFTSPHPIENMLVLRGESEAILTWLKGQSAVHLKDFAQFLQMTLQSILHVKLDYDARFKILELFHPAVEYICHTLGNHYLDPNTPPAEKNLQIINLAQELEISLVIHYLSVIKELIGAEHSPETKALMGASIYHSMLHLSEIIIRSYEFYSPTYPQSWYYMHQLYQYADTYKLLHYAPNVKEKNALKANSIRQVYLETLLLATASPYELQHHDLRLIMSMLPLWYTHVNLSALNKGVGDFVVHIDKDTPPFRQEFTQINGVGDRYYLFDIKSLEHHLHLLLDPSQKTLSIAPEETTIPAYIIEQLIQAWNKATPRRYPRVMMRGNLRLVAGLPTLHYYVSQQSTSAEQFAENDSKKQLHKISTWQIVDTSPNGYCLKMRFDPQIRLYAGELVGLQEEHEVSLNRWGIGMIRWVKHGVDDSYTIGIQLIAPTGTPIQFCIQRPYDKPTENIAGFLLPSLGRLQQQETLLLPVLPFNNGDVLNIITVDRNYTVKLSSLAHRTGSFMQYQFEAP